MSGVTPGFLIFISSFRDIIPAFLMLFPDKCWVMTNVSSIDWKALLKRTLKTARHQLFKRLISGTFLPEALRRYFVFFPPFPVWMFNDMENCTKAGEIPIRWGIPSNVRSLMLQKSKILRVAFLFFLQKPSFQNFRLTSYKGLAIKTESTFLKKGRCKETPKMFLLLKKNQPSCDM